MPPFVAAIVCVAGILGLFYLDRDRQFQTSKALWLPVIWLSLAGSRMVSQWLGTTPATDQFLEGSPLDRNILTGLLLAGLLVLFSRATRVSGLLRTNGSFLLFFLYCAASVLWSDFPEVAFKRWIKALGDLVMVLIVLTDREPYAATKRLLARVGFVLLPLSILFIKYFPELGRGYVQWTWEPAHLGVTTNKNTLGMICMVFGLGSLWRLIDAFGVGKGARQSGTVIAHGVLLAMALWLFWTADSMTSLACFLLAGGLVLATSRSWLGRKPFLVHCLVLTALFMTFAVLFLDIGSTILGTMGRDATLTGRTEIWDVVLSVAANPLVGTGFESFWLGPRLEKIWSVYWFRPNEAHNGYLETFLNLGWIGVSLLAIVLATGYRRVIRAVCNHQPASSLCLGYFVAAVAYNFTESAIRVFNPVWIAFLLAIVAVPVLARKNAGQPLYRTEFLGSDINPEAQSVAGESDAAIPQFAMSVGSLSPSSAISRTIA